MLSIVSWWQLQWLIKVLYFFSSRFVSVHVVHPYSSIDVTAAWKKLRFILSVRSDFHKKLDGNYTRMLRAILNKSWQQHPTRHQLYGHLPPITKTIHVRRTRHAGHCWRSRDELIRDVLLWIPHTAAQKQDDQHERTFSSYVRIQVVVLKTCLGRWTIGRSGERGSGMSVLPARYDDDDDDYISIFIVILSISNTIGYILKREKCFIYI